MESGRRFVEGVFSDDGVLRRDDPQGLSNRRDNILQLARPLVVVGVVFPIAVAPFFDIVRDKRHNDSDVVPLINLSWCFSRVSDRDVPNQ